MKVNLSIATLGTIHLSDGKRVLYFIEKFSEWCSNENNNNNNYNNNLYFLITKFNLSAQKSLAISIVSAI